MGDLTASAILTWIQYYNPFRQGIVYLEPEVSEFDLSYAKITNR